MNTANMRTVENSCLLLFSIYLMSYGISALELTDKITPRPDGSTNPSTRSISDGSQVLCESCSDTGDCERQGGSRCTEGICYTLEDKCLISGISITPIECVDNKDCKKSLCINGVCTPCAADEKFKKGACVKKVEAKSLGAACDSHAQCAESAENSFCVGGTCICSMGYMRHGNRCKSHPFRVRMDEKCSETMECSAAMMGGADCRDGTCQCLSGYTKEYDSCKKPYSPYSPPADDYYKPSYGGSDSYKPSSDNEFIDTEFRRRKAAERTTNIIKVVGGIIILIITGIALTYYYMKRRSANARRRQAYLSEHPTTQSNAGNYGNALQPMMPTVAYDPNVSRPYPVQNFATPPTLPQNNSDFTAYGPATNPSAYGPATSPSAYGQATSPSVYGPPQNNPAAFPPIYNQVTNAGYANNYPNTNNALPGYDSQATQKM